MSAVEQKLSNSGYLCVLYASCPQKTAKTRELDKRILDAFDDIRTIEEYRQTAKSNICVIQEFIANTQLRILQRQNKSDASGVADSESSEGHLIVAGQSLSENKGYCEEQEAILTQLCEDIDKLREYKSNLLTAQCSAQVLVSKMSETERAISEHRRDQGANLRLVTHLREENRRCVVEAERDLTVEELQTKIVTFNQKLLRTDRNSLVI